MNIEDRVSLAELIHSATIKWGVKKYNCSVAFYKTEPLEDLYWVICSILNTNGGSYEKDSLGVLLGFSMMTFERGDTTTMYRDKAEIHLFNDILHRVEKEHLITISDSEVRLTELGRISIEQNKHYTFFRGTQAIYEHLTLKSSDNDLEDFPFYEDMGIYTRLAEGKQYWPEDEHVRDAVFTKQNSLINRLNLQSNIHYNIYLAEQEKYFDPDTVDVNVNLYQDESGYFPVVMNGDTIAKAVTTLLLNEENSLLCENIILDCRFQKLWNDQDAILDYNTLYPFFDLVNFADLTKDRRVVWGDEKLFNVIVNKSDIDCWRNISMFCDLDVIKHNLKEYKEQFNWQQLSRRIDDAFLIDNFKVYPWDLEIISNDLERDIETIEQLILIGKETEEDWDWDELRQRLSEVFILNNLDKVRIDLTEFTRDTVDVHNSIVKNPDNLWDWNKVVNDFGMDFILDNIAVLSSHINLVKLFDRAFSDAIWRDKFFNDKEFRNAVKEDIANNRSLASFIANDKVYLWTQDLIDWLENNNLIVWQSTQYTKGFECNESLIWDYKFFEHNRLKVKSDEGIKVVSSNISDINIVIDYSSFSWDWDILSSNVSLLKNQFFFKEFGSKLNWVNAITSVPDISFVEETTNIKDLIGENEDAWMAFSSRADLDFVRNNYKYPWDWSVLTSRMFKKLKLNNLENPNFVNKWDWAYLTENVSIEFLNENLSKYSSYWNWQIAFGRLLNVENKKDTRLLDKYAIIISNIQGNEKCGKAWTAFTQAFSFKELKKVLKDTQKVKYFFWDLKDFCTRKEFNIYSDLDEYRDFIDWKALSSSDYINEQFHYNKDSGITQKKWYNQISALLTNPKNKWDFKKLSHHSALYALPQFLLNFKAKIDWAFISEKSPYFSVGNDMDKIRQRILPFREYVSFDILSKRSDVDAPSLIKAFPQEAYDFNAMMANGTFSVTQEDVESNYPKYNWDWKLVSESTSFAPTGTFMLKHLKENVDWNSLSKRDIQSMWSNEALIVKIAEKEPIRVNIDWYNLSSYSYFPISKQVFYTVPLESLNWGSLSSRKGIVDFLDQCIEYVDWHVLSDNTALHIIHDDVLFKYKDYLDWTVICRRKDFHFSVERLQNFHDYIDWNQASASEDIEFTKKLVESYADKWNWPILIKNKAFFNRVKVQDFSEVRAENINRFISQFTILNPKAYHFTHMSNAIKIILSQKLQSREIAEGNFDNSAGAGVIDRSSKAHRFARFYYRPGTPTQFYNEFLGKDHTLKYYEPARKLGLPKCPMPVFFVFDLEEAISLFPDKCYYSNGNMQKDSTTFYKVIEDPSMIDGDGVYDQYNKNAKQQEFLVDGELDLSRLSSLQIYCCDEKQCRLLKKAVKNSPLSHRITVNRSVYEFKNKQLFFSEGNEELIIETNYEDDYEFRVSYTKDTPEIVNIQNIKRQKGNSVYLSSEVDIKKSVPFEIYFEVTQPRSANWLIYSNA